MNKKVITLFLLAGILVPTLCACSVSAGNESAETESDTAAPLVTEAETEAEDPERPSELDGLNFNGYRFRMYMRADEPNSMYAEESSGDTMDDAVYRRNLAVSELLNVNFVNLYTEGDRNATNPRTVLLANEDAYDIVLPHARVAFNSYIMDGLALDWNDLVNVNLDKSYWYADARDSFTINGHVYGMVGDIDFDNLSWTKCLYFNKQLVENYDLPSPYDLVSQNRWTLDTFTELIRSVKSDLNGDSKLELGTDVIGYATSWWSGPINVLYAGNQRVARISEEGELYLTINSERTVELYNRYFSLFQNDNCFLRLNDDNTPIQDAFMAGNLLIMDDILMTAERLRGMELDFGILPWPKFDESEKNYHTGCDAGCNLILVPVCIPDIECTSAVLEAMGYYGKKIVIPAYYDISLQTKAARDEESAAMLDIIRESRLYDVGYFVRVTGLGDTGYELSKLPDHAFASFYASHEAAALDFCRTVNEFFAERDS